MVQGFLTQRCWLGLGFGHEHDVTCRYSSEMDLSRVHSTAELGEGCLIGDGCAVWQYVHIREGASLGPDCVIGRGVYVGPGVRIGARVKVQNYAQVFEPAVIGDCVFIGPAAVLTNDRHPRSTGQSGLLKTPEDWVATGVEIQHGASIGAQAVVLSGVTVGAWAMVGAGAVVTSDVPDHALIVGNPGRQDGWVGRAGKRLSICGGEYVCPETGEIYVEAEGGLEEAISS